MDRRPSRLLVRRKRGSSTKLLASKVVSRDRVIVAERTATDKVINQEGQRAVAPKFSHLGHWY